MAKKSFSTNFFIILVFLLATFLITCVYLYRTWGKLDYFGGYVKNEQGKDIPYTLPNFSFINQDNQPLSNDWIKHKIWVANYFFTTCGTICPIMMHNMVTIVQPYIENKGYTDVKIISFTVDPETDTPAQLKRFAQFEKINPNIWQLVTGNKKDLYLFARENLRLVATQMPKNEIGGQNDFIHSEKFVLIDQDMHIRGYYNGTNQNEINQLLKDIDKLR